MRWVDLEGEYTRQQKHLIARAVAGDKNAVRIVRRSDDRYQAFITIDEPVKGQEIKFKQIPDVALIGGIDVNLDHLAVVIADRQGQFRKFKVFRYPNLGEIPKEKSKPRIGVIAKEVVKWLAENGVGAISIEDLKIKQEADRTARQNRRTVTFSHRQFITNLMRTSRRQGLDVKKINPAYTSFIGKWKYTRQFGISTHIAAAFVIA